MSVGIHDDRGVTMPLADGKLIHDEMLGLRKVNVGKTQLQLFLIQAFGHSPVNVILAGYGTAGSAGAQISLNNSGQLIGDAAMRDKPGNDFIGLAAAGTPHPAKRKHNSRALKAVSRSAANFALTHGMELVARLSALGTGGGAYGLKLEGNAVGNGTGRVVLEPVAGISVGEVCVSSGLTK